jgi:hypothetical protein
MASITPTKETQDNGTTVIMTWAAITTTDTEGEPIRFNPWGDRTIQAVGNFSGGATIALHGSNDGTNYSAIRDVSDAAIALAVDEIQTVQEVPLYVKPVIAGGDGSADIDVILVMRRSNESRQ